MYSFRPVRWSPYPETFLYAGLPLSYDVQLIRPCSRSTLSMTFGRPAMIPESYVKLELPLATLQVTGQTPQPQETPQVDALAFTATM